MHDEWEASVNSLMARRSTRAVIIAESRIGRTAFATLGGASTITTLITDDGITEKQLTEFADHGYTVIVA